MKENKARQEEKIGISADDDFPESGKPCLVSAKILKYFDQILMRSILELILDLARVQESFM